VNVLQFIAKRTGLGKRHAKKLLESGEVILNGQPLTDGCLPIGKFDQLIAAGENLQENTPRYILLNKPAGILSATTDQKHKTVIDLIDEPWASELHLAGRLDRSTTGLVILTNDSSFSESLTRPENKVPKTYVVETDLPITPEAIEKFCRGMSFDKEKTRSQPAIVEFLSETSCRLTIHEGLHHQIKRMFLRFGIRVTKLHRESVGPYLLGNLEPGEWRQISSNIPKEPDTKDFPILRNRWIAICNRVGLDWITAWDELKSHYTNPSLAYHNFDHIGDCLARLDEYPHLAEDSEAVEMAIWFHDVIYDPAAADNEENSVRFAKRFLGDLSISGKVAELILATRHVASPASQDAKLICDIDLSILGSEPHRYRTYADSIRSEYSWVPTKEYRSGRSRILKNFLHRPEIFTTEAFRERYERQARANLQAELVGLNP
jgi:16S rRNA pseudouridine516 synthase